MKVNIVKLSIIALASLQVASAMAQKPDCPDYKAPHFTIDQWKGIDKPVVYSEVAIRREIALLKAERTELRIELDRLEKAVPGRRRYDEDRFIESRQRVNPTYNFERIMWLKAKISEISERILLLEARLEIIPIYREHGYDDLPPRHHHIGEFIRTKHNAGD